MQEVMDTVNPGFWEQWKATEKRIAVDDKYVKCDYCGGIVSVVGPTDDGKRAMRDDCPDYPLWVAFLRSQMSGITKIA
jgi:hypothetical protein